MAEQQGVSAGMQPQQASSNFRKCKVSAQAAPQHQRAAALP